MNFNQLEYVIAVHRHKHFGKAAESCHVTQATLSGMIKKLEEELGLVLFDRSRQPVKTTEVGLEFIQLATEILCKQQDMLRLKDQEGQKLEGNLTMGIIPTIASSLLPLILPPLMEANPGLNLTIREITTEEIIQQLLTDEIDLAILATPLENEMVVENILYYEAMMVYGATGSGKKFVSSADVKDSKIWLLEEGHCFRNQAMTICDIKEKELADSNLNFVGNSFETLLNLTDKFGGYTLVPELYAKEMPPARKAVVKPFQVPVPVREVSLVAVRPFAKKRAMEYLTASIKAWVADQLITAEYRNQDLEIIGI